MAKSTTFTGFLKLCKEHKIDDEVKYYKLRKELEQKFVDWHGPKTDDKGNPLISGKQSFINELNSLRLRKSEMAQKNNKSEVERLNQAIKDKGKELGVMEGNYYISAIITSKAIRYSKRSCSADHKESKDLATV
ncbi:hypothetical protein DdX_18707 [Ditylenchus destructor]|uniref:Uncharacterized protein n=1 Tax=Ditylenchus destructor TaxID=166010 RepID=A0AAD4QY20_9BILA|nr:hypothetical protein DdX_18707 [Ditylenchus destructor]